MKKITLMITMALLCIGIFSSKAQAQSTAPDTTYFVGNWELKATGLPQGDITMKVILEKKDGKLSGSIIDPSGNIQPILFSKVELEKKVLTMHYSAQGQEVYMTMEKKEGDNVTGSIMDMFDLTGKRIKETKPVE